MPCDVVIANSPFCQSVRAEDEVQEQHDSQVATIALSLEASAKKSLASSPEVDLFSSIFNNTTL